MWRLLPIVLLASCAANEALDPTAEGQRPDSHRVVNQVDLPLAPSSNMTTEQAAIKDAVAAANCVRVVTRCDGPC